MTLNGGKSVSDEPEVTGSGAMRINKHECAVKNHTGLTLEIFHPQINYHLHSKFSSRYIAPKIVVNSIIHIICKLLLKNPGYQTKVQNKPQGIGLNNPGIRAKTPNVGRNF